MTIGKKNFYYTQKLQKQAHDITVKSKNYAFSNKFWLNSKYIKIKQNCTLEIKFFDLF